MDDFKDVIVSLAVVVFGLLSYFVSDKKKKQETKRKTGNAQTTQETERSFELSGKEILTSERELLANSEVIQQSDMEVSIPESSTIENKEGTFAYGEAEERAALDFDLKQAVLYETILHAPYAGKR